MADQLQSRTRTAGILIFDDVEVLDVCGPFEVLATSRTASDTNEEDALFRVYTIAPDLRVVRCRGGLLVQPHYAIDEHPALDLLVVPGGPGTRRERLNPRILDWIKAQDKHTEITTSVCTGAFLLAASGLLAGKRATTHWASIDWMRKTYPDISMLGDLRVVDEGHIITSAGVSAGIDMALHLVARLHGAETALWTARRMEYEWGGPLPAAQ